MQEVTYAVGRRGRVLAGLGAVDCVILELVGRLPYFRLNTILREDETNG